MGSHTGLWTWGITLVEDLGWDRKGSSLVSQNVLQGVIPGLGRNWGWGGCIGVQESRHQRCLLNLITAQDGRAVLSQRCFAPAGPVSRSQPGPIHPPGLATTPAAQACLNRPLKILADQEPPRPRSASLRRFDHSPQHTILLALSLPMWSSPRDYL